MKYILMDYAQEAGDAGEPAHHHCSDLGRL